MADVAVVPQANGFHQDTSHSASDLAQYDRILNLRDEVITGKHPRLKVDFQKLDKLAKVSSPAAAGPNGSVAGSAHQSKLNTQNANNLAVQHNKDLSSTPSSTLPTILPTTLPNPSRQPPPAIQSTTMSSSGFDPIFLEKSDGLIIAEMKLLRGRIEESLEQQVHQKKNATRHRDTDHEALPDFDVSEVLEKALERIKPYSASDIVGAQGSGSAGSDSVDDGTFYSSQHNDSEVDDADMRPKLKATKPCKYFFEGKCHRGNNCNFSHDPAFKKNLQDSTADTHMSNAYAGVTRRGSPDYGREEGELVEDSSYSPPNAQEPSGTSKNNTRFSPRPQPNRTPPRDPYPAPPPRNSDASPIFDNQSAHASLRFSGRASPTYDGQVVRNHITSPIAPQPARVSPLAVTKMPNLGRSNGPTGHEDNHNNKRKNQKQNGNQGGPNAGQGKSKKRRREQEKIEASRNVAPRRFIDSPGPVIKEEPVSPPPLGAIPAPIYRDMARSPAIPAPIYRDMARSPANQTHSSAQSERIMYRPARERVYADDQRIERVSSPSGRRVVSGPVGHHDVEPNLRRVVSTRNLGRPSSPQQDSFYYSPPSTIARPGSRAYVLDEPQESRSAYRGSVQPQSRPVEQYRHRMDSPEVREISYAPREVMAPPPRRIVTDKYGRQFYEVPVEHYTERVPVRVGSVAPQARYIEDLDPPPTSARASVRSEPESYQESRFVQRYSPEPTSRYTQEPTSRYAQEPTSRYAQEPRYEQAPRQVEYYTAPPQRVASRAASRAVSRAPGSSRQELHQDDYQSRGPPRVVEIPRYADEMPPPQPVRMSVAPSGYQPRERYVDDYEPQQRYAPTERPVERTRLATTQPETGPRYMYESAGPRYVDASGRYVEAPKDGFVRPREPVRAGSVFFETSPRGRRVEYIERQPGSGY